VESAAATPHLRECSPCCKSLSGSTLAGVTRGARRVASGGGFNGKKSPDQLRSASLALNAHFERPPSTAEGWPHVEGQNDQAKLPQTSPPLQPHGGGHQRFVLVYTPLPFDEKIDCRWKPGTLGGSQIEPNASFSPSGKPVSQLSRSRHLGGRRRQDEEGRQTTNLVRWIPQRLHVAASALTTNKYQPITSVEESFCRFCTSFPSPALTIRLGASLRR